MTGTGKGMNAFFEEPEEATKQHTDIQTKQQPAPDLERATFYIRPSQHITLEELKIKLRQQKIKTNKSELLREAIDLLSEQDLEALAQRITNK